MKPINKQATRGEIDDWLRELEKDPHFREYKLSNGKRHDEIVVVVVYHRTFKVINSDIPIDLEGVREYTGSEVVN